MVERQPMRGLEVVRYSRQIGSARVVPDQAGRDLAAEIGSLDVKADHFQTQSPTECFHVPEKQGIRVQNGVERPSRAGKTRGWVVKNELQTYWAVAVVILIGIIVGGCSTKSAPPSRVIPPSRALATADKAALLAQLEIAQKAVNEWDYETMIGTVPPALFRVFGKEEFEKSTRAALENLKQQGMKFVHTDFGEPSVLYDAGNEEVCFVPRTSILDMRGTRVRSIAYWVAVRAKDDADWKFIDGAGIHQRPESLWVFFPKLPREIQIPDWKQEVLK